MAKLEVLQCATCSSPLSPGALKCEYCGAKNVIKSKQNPLKISSEMAQKYIAFYGNKTKENPKDTNALYSMGLLYLSLKNYELARRNFKDAIDQSPLDADVYYYYALSLVAGKSIRSMSGKEVSRVEEYINTALGMETKCKYLVLLAVVQIEYYQENKLVIPHEKGPRQLLEEAADYSPDELDEIIDNCNLRSEISKYNIDKLMGKEIEDDDEEEDEDSEDEDYEEEDDEFFNLLNNEEEYEKAVNLTEEQRRSFYEYWYEPEKPAHLDVPAGVGFGFKRALLLVGSVLLFLIMLSFDTCVGCSIKMDETVNSVENAVEDHVNTMVKKYDMTYSPEELEKIITEFKEDSIKKALKHEKFIAENQNLSKLFNWVGKDGTTQHFYRKTSIWGWIGVLIVFSPLIIWIIVTLGGIIGTLDDRKNAKRYNREVDKNYAEAMNNFNAKPTEAQMVVYIRNFLSKIVDIELRYHKKSEEDLKGKTLYLNNYFNYQNESENFNHSAVEYTIVLLDEDCVTVIRDDWRVWKDNWNSGEFVQLSYGDIKNVKLTSNELSFGDTVIEIPDEQVFEYQSDDFDNELTFSNTRTSDVRDFAVSLRKLVQEYKNRS